MAAPEPAGVPAGAVGIGDVLDQLRREFPDVTVSKIRFLEAAGLVTPARSRSGYRRFSGADLDRLRWVLRLQRDEYLPLRVIRDRLADPAADADAAAAAAAAAQGTATPLPVPPTVAQAPSAATSAGWSPSPARRLSREEVVEATGITTAQLVEAEGHGLVRSRSGWYDGADVAAAAAVAGLAAHGLGARHLRGLRSAAEREAGLVEQVVAPQLRARRPDARARGVAQAGELRALTGRLHDALVEGALRDAGLEGRWPRPAGEPAGTGPRPPD